MEKVKVKGTFNKGDLLIFPCQKKIISLRIGEKNYSFMGDNVKRTFRPMPGQFFIYDNEVIVSCYEKLKRPIVVLETISVENIPSKEKIKILKERSAPKSALYSMRKTKCKIKWGTSSPRIGDVERQLTIPSKLGLIHSEGNTFLLNNRVIAYVENNTVVPTVDITTPEGDYLYRRVMSIFELTTVFSEGNEYQIKKGGEILKNGYQIGFNHNNGIKYNTKANHNDKKIIQRMLKFDETLIKGSTKKREIQKSLA